MMNVYFTVDTESSMGGAWSDATKRPLPADRHIFCRIGGEDHGIGLITAIMRRHGFAATYFVETLATLVNGAADTRKVFDYLLEQGQDVQLHIHPNFRLYADALDARDKGREYHLQRDGDLLGTYNEARQMQLLEEACFFYRTHTGAQPLAFRAGCYSAGAATLRCLRKLGIVLDTSFNPCYQGWSFAGADLKPNRVCQIEGVWEIPVTVARTQLPEGHAGFKHADPSAVSFREMRTMLEAGVRNGQRHFVIVFHSFSAVKSRDMTYNELRPDAVVIRRLERLMHYLASHPQLYTVSTFGEIAANGASSLESGEHPIATLGLLAAGWRKAVQGLNRMYWI